MDILGIGPLELLFILIIALIVLGPKDMAKTGRTIGRFLRQIVTSPSWGAVQSTSKELRNLPNRLMREAGLEDDLKNINTILPDPKDLIPKISQDDPESNAKDIEKTPEPASSQDDISNWTTPPQNVDSKEQPKSPTNSGE